MERIKLFVQGRGKLVGKAKHLITATLQENIMSGFSIEVGDYVKIVNGDYVKGRIGKVIKVFSERHWAIFAKIVDRKGESSLVDGYCTVLSKGDYIRIHESNYPALEHWLSGGEVVVPAISSEHLFVDVSSPKWELAGCYQIKEEKTYRQGQRFILNRTGEEHILSRVGPRQVALIGMISGNRWSNPIPVEDPLEITQEEFEKISGGNSTYYWTLVS